MNYSHFHIKSTNLLLLNMFVGYTLLKQKPLLIFIPGTRLQIVKIEILELMLKRPVFSTFNIIYQVIILWCLLFANTYLNDKLVPSGLLSKNNHRRMDTTVMLGHAGFKTLALLIEAALLILITYAINKAVLSDTQRKNRRNAVVKRTVKTHIIITLCFIVYLIVG